MEKLYSHILGTPVMEDDEIRPLTTVKDVVMDPDRGMLLALVVDVSRNMVIAPIDILSWGRAIRIHNGGVIIEGEEVVRIAEVLKRGISIFHNKVFTEEGVYLGRVFDFSLDNKSLSLNNLYIQKTFMGIIRLDSRIIPAKEIVEITSEKIIVKSDMKVIKEEAAAVSTESAAV